MDILKMDVIGSFLTENLTNGCFLRTSNIHFVFFKESIKHVDLILLIQKRHTLELKCLLLRKKATHKEVYLSKATVC